MKDLQPPPPSPIHWAVQIGDVTIVSPLRRTAFAAAQSVRTDRGFPHFSECVVKPLDEALQEI
jgi:hypothetical protein